MKRGDNVWIARLHEEGILLSVTKSGKYRVQVDRLVVECDAAEIGTPPKGKRKKSNLEKLNKHKRPESGRTFSVDLHGLTVDEALSKLTGVLNAAALEGAERIEVVHGIGTGRVKRAVLKYLAELPIVEAVKEDARNAGATWVYL